jgi:hypothetical protein
MGKHWDLIGVAVIAASCAASADNLNIAQFLPEDTTYSSPLSDVTAGGVDYTIFSPNGSFTLNRKRFQDSLSSRKGS